MSYVSQTISQKLRIISFIATISVVVIHTNHLEMFKECSVVWWIGNFIGYLQRWAVPYFFAVSGFFFARAFEKQPVFRYWKTFLLIKVKTLLVPYLLWGIVYGILTMTILRLGVAMQRGDNDIWAKTVFASWGHWAFFDNLIGVTHAPLIGALWYVRVLLIFFLFSPIWILIFRYFKYIGIFFCFLLICCSPISGMYEEQIILFNIVFRIKLNAIGWLLLGMICSNFNLERCQINRIEIPLVLWIVGALLPLPWVWQDAAQPIFVVLCHQVHPIFAILFFWRLGEFLLQFFPNKLPWICKLGFWIYCSHHPITGFVGALGHLIFGRSLVSKIILQTSSWIIVLGICIFSHMS